MAYTVTFPTAGPRPALDEVAAWLTEQGEPFDQENPHTLQLRALPVRLVLPSDAESLQAHIEVTPTVPLSRLVDQLFALSMRSGADVSLTGFGGVSRAQLWVKLADEQDRLRLARAFAHAEEMGRKEQVLRRLWAVLSSLSPGHDVRWDASRERIVELKEVGTSDGIAIEEAAWLVENPSAGDVVAVDVKDPLHILAWRWLSEAHPGLTDH